MSGPLTGVTIVDFTQILAGPYATCIAADMGADVIKIEQPEVGDRARPRDGVSRLGGFLAHNRNKRSVTIDLRDRRGLAIVHRLLATADACVSNFRPGFMESIGLGYEELSERYPRLIYVIGTGFGLAGPYVEGPNPRPGVDIVGQAMSGLMAACRDGDGYPLGAGAPVTDQTQGILMALGLSLALNARHVTGRGQLVESSLLGASLALQTGQIGLTMVSGLPTVPGRRTHFLDPVYGSYRTSDGHVVLGNVPPDRWDVFCKALGRADLASDERFADPGARQRRAIEFGEVLDEIMPTRTTADWLARMAEADVAAAPVYDYFQMADDPQVRANEYMVDMPVGDGRQAAFVGVPIKLSDTPGEIRTGTPGLGADTREVLLAVGYTDSELDDLAAEGVI